MFCDAAISYVVTCAAHRPSRVASRAHPGGRSAREQGAGDIENRDKRAGIRSSKSPLFTHSGLPLHYHNLISILSKIKVQVPNSKYPPFCTFSVRSEMPHVLDFLWIFHNINIKFILIPPNHFFCPSNCKSLIQYNVSQKPIQYCKIQCNAIIYWVCNFL